MSHRHDYRSRPPDDDNNPSWGIIFGFVVLAVLMLAAGMCSRAHGQTVATVEINAEPWYAAKTDMGDCGLRRGYAPFPVFFEGWKSQPSNHGVTYSWDFGDGATFDGFDAAHVYESPGVYTATLTVRTAGGSTASATATIDVLAPLRTFYVDSVAGNDAYDGLSPDRPWRTALYAFQGISSRRYQPGDRILFRRGQVYPLASKQLSLSGYGWGYSFGAYGEGAKPLIRRGAEAEPGPLLSFGREGARHIGFCDLALEAPPKGTMFNLIAPAHNLLWLRCDFTGAHEHLQLNGPKGAGQSHQSGMFVFGCTGRDSSGVANYLGCKRAAYVDNAWDHSGSHGVYGGWPDMLIFAGNQFTRTSFGKAALRISSASESFDRPVEHVLVQDNRFIGWIDPVPQDWEHTDGTRWNRNLCTVSPNRGAAELMRHVWWRRNVVTGAENPLQIAAVEDGYFVQNTFDMPDCGRWTSTVIFGSLYERRPLRGVRFSDNTLIVRGPRRHVFTVEPCRVAGQEHAGLLIVGNTVQFADPPAKRYLWVCGSPGLFMANRITGVAPSDKLVQFGGYINSGGTLQTLGMLYAETGMEPPP